MSLEAKLSENPALAPKSTQDIVLREAESAITVGSISGAR